MDPGLAAHHGAVLGPSKARTRVQVAAHCAASGARYWPRWFSKETKSANQQKPVKPPLQKYFCFSESKSGLKVRCPVPARGAFRDRHERWAGDAMDADGVARRAAPARTAKSCGPGAPTLVSSRRDFSRRRRWQKSPVTGESTKETVKPLRGESRVNWLFL
jgi:hypothetical protein